MHRVIFVSELDGIWSTAGPSAPEEIRSYRIKSPQTISSLSHSAIHGRPVSPQVSSVVG